MRQVWVRSWPRRTRGFRHAAIHVVVTGQTVLDDSTDNVVAGNGNDVEQRGGYFNRSVVHGLSGDDDLFGRYFGLNEALEQLFACKVDLVMVGALKNPYFVESVNRSRRPVYASPLAQGA